MLARTLQLAADQVASQLQHKQLQLQLDLPERLPPLQADPDAVRQIAVILIEHAIEASPTNSAVELVVQVDDPHWVTLSVSDSGSGVPAEELGRAFQPELPSEGELAAVRQLAETAGGRVWIESELGRGSTVTVQLPVRKESSNSAS